MRYPNVVNQHKVKHFHNIQEIPQQILMFSCPATLSYESDLIFTHIDDEIIQAVQMIDFFTFWYHNCPLKQHIYCRNYFEISSIAVQILPEYAPAVCAPADLIGALAPGKHHTVRCFFCSGSHG